MDGNCSVGSVLLKEKGLYKIFQVWLNKRGIVNLLSIPMLEEAGYKVSTHTDNEWKVTTPRGKVIIFKRDLGICNHMLYIDLREHAEGLVILESVEKNMKMFTKKEIERTQLACAVQRQIL